jgi:ubiquitin-activating enzyme E1
MSASVLRAVSFGISIPDWAKDTDNLADAVSKVAVPEFKPKSGVKIETDEKTKNISGASVDDAAVIEDLLTKLEACAKKLPPKFQMKPIQFEKVRLI